MHPVLCKTAGPPVPEMRGRIGLPVQQRCGSCGVEHDGLMQHPWLQREIFLPRSIPSPWQISSLDLHEVQSIHHVRHYPPPGVIRFASIGRWH